MNYCQTRPLEIIPPHIGRAGKFAGVKFITPLFFYVILYLVLHSERNFNRRMTFHVASAKNTAFAKNSTIIFEGLQNNH